MGNAEISLCALIAGFALDLTIGDPLGWPHIVKIFGGFINMSERVFRRILPETPKGEILGGTCVVISICAAAFGGGLALLRICGLASPWVRLIAESLTTWQCLSMKSLKTAVLSVYQPLTRNDVDTARKAVSMIVGRDTERLDKAGITRAAVETAAENANDGVIAPLFWIALGGGAFGLLYKAVNTMDSMLGYKNEKYLYFGRTAAILDDFVNFIPARIAGALMVLVSGDIKTVKNAWRVFRRDRLNHKSPNAGHTEAACAGALRVRLGGDNYYFGKLVSKPAIGDGEREIDAEDIKRVNRLLYASGCAFCALCVIVKGAFLWIFR